MALLAASALATLLLSGSALAAVPPYAHTGPLACQANDKYPMLPTFHIIGNVTQATDGAITLEPINDCSGVTYYKGIYHVWHQCCQNHWDHVGSDTPECSHPAFHSRIVHIAFAESGHSTGAPVLCLSLVSTEFIVHCFVLTDEAAPACRLRCMRR
jgi:hypothetical protein